MGFPRPAYYTIEELAEYWKISIGLIEIYTERDQLQHCSLWYNSYHDGRNTMPGNMHPEGADENNHTGFWSLESIIYELEEIERFEKEHGIIPAPQAKKGPQPIQSEGKALKIKRTNDFRDILMKTCNQLAFSQDKKPTWKECYDYLKNNDSRKFVDEKGYIKTVNEKSIITTDSNPNKQYISKESFIKRFNRLANN